MKQKAKLTYTFPSNLMVPLVTSLEEYSDNHLNADIRYTIENPEEERITLKVESNDVDAVLEWVGTLHAIPEYVQYQEEQKNEDDCHIAWELERSECRALVEKLRQFVNGHPSWIVSYKPFVSLSHWKNGEVKLIVPHDEANEMFELMKSSLFLREVFGLILTE